MATIDWNEAASVGGGINENDYDNLRAAVVHAASDFNIISRETVLKTASGVEYRGLDLLSLARQVPVPLYDVRQEARAFEVDANGHSHFQRRLTKLIGGAIGTLRERDSATPWSLQFLDIATNATRGGYSLAAASIDLALAAESEVQPSAWLSADAEGISLDTISAKIDAIGRTADAAIYGF